MIMDKLGAWRPPVPLKVLLWINGVVVAQLLRLEV
jgi:hypothetical protein